MTRGDSLSCDGKKAVYSAKVKKRHKSHHRRYQARQLTLYSEFLTYSKVDKQTEPLGFIRLKAMRAEVSSSGDCNFELLPDDITSRRFTFHCKSDNIRANFVWQINGEQYMQYGLTYMKLSSATINFMKQAAARYEDISVLAKQRYAAAADKFFDEDYLGTCQRDLTGGNKHEYEDLYGIRDKSNRIMENLTSDSESDSGSYISLDSSQSETEKVKNVCETNVSTINVSTIKKKSTSVKRKSVGFENDDLYTKFESKSHPNTLSTLHDGEEEDENYMDLSSLKHSAVPTTINKRYSTPIFAPLSSPVVLRNPPTPRPAAPTSKPPSQILPSPDSSTGLSKQSSSEHPLLRKQRSRSDEHMKIVYNINPQHIDFGSREIGAVKIRVHGDMYYTEVAITKLGHNLRELMTALYIYLDINKDREIIEKIVKLPDVLVKNDQDVTRITAGRELEVYLKTLK